MVAELVAEALDGDGAVGRQRTGGRALLTQVAEQVLRGQRIEVVLAPEPALGAVLSAVRTRVAGVELAWLDLGWRLMAGTPSRAVCCHNTRPLVLSRHSTRQRWGVASFTDSMSP